MAGKVQETDLMHRVAQFVTELRRLLRASVQSGDVDYRQCFEWQRLGSFSANLATPRKYLLPWYGRAAALGRQVPNLRLPTP
jgi:hypothetical protein